MSGIAEKYNQFKKSAYFASGKFVIYSLGIYLAATFTIGCLGAVIGFPLLTFPLAMLISNPVVWVLMGIVLTAAYTMVVEPLFHLAKDYINKKKASKGEKSEEKEVEPQKSPEEQEQTVNNQGNPKTPDRDSGIVPSSKPGSENSSRRSSITSKDSGLGGKEFSENLQTLVHQTNRGNYTYWLADNDIVDIARVVYGYSQSKHSNNVYFLAPGYSNGWNELTKEFFQDYRGELEQNHKLIFTSVFHINGNHWTALVIKPDAGDKKFRAYYCDSFGNQLPNNVLNIVDGELSKEGWLLNIASSKVKQQSDGHNCEIFALENAHRITQMFNEGKSFDEINAELLKYKPSKKELEEKRKEFAEALRKDEQSRGNTPSPVLGGPGKPKLQKSKSLDSGLDIISRKTDDSDDKRRRNSYSPSIDSGVSVGSTESEQPKQTKIVRYNTTGDGNCFFHAVFGDNSSGQYKAERAQNMRLEWHRFLSQFEHLDDASMPAPLKGQLYKVFSMFLDGTEERIEQVKRIIESAKQKNAEVETAYNNAKKEEAETSVENLFLNMPELYQAYLEIIKSQSYYVFIEEILILASLANIEITVHHQHNGINGHGVFKPDPQMINDDQLNQVFDRESYKLNDELWSNKKQEVIYLKSGHYERAEIVELEETQSIGSALQSAAACVNALGLST